MHLSKLRTSGGDRWAADHQFLAKGVTLGQLLKISAGELEAAIRTFQTDEMVSGAPMAPIDAQHEVWACGVTYLRSRNARMAESTEASIYDRVYSAVRPELFFKAPGWRVIGPDGLIQIRSDSKWNVPEPELALVINSAGEIVGYTAANDVSSRDIEGENPLYLPQAKSYDGACALGQTIHLVGADGMRDLPIHLSVERTGSQIFTGVTSTAQLKRTLEELAKYLFLALNHPQGALLLTGTGIVPPDTFSLVAGDRVSIQVGDVVLGNTVAD